MFFINLPESVEQALADRGVDAREIRYTAKADVSKENQYGDMSSLPTRKGRKPGSSSA